MHRGGSSLCWATVLMIALMGAFHTAVAQESTVRIEPPVLGFVFDPRRGAIRTISGTPGAASLGEPTPLDEHITRATVAAAAPVALVEVVGKPGLHVASWANVATTLQSLDGAAEHTDRAALSADGRWAALAREAGVEIWRITTGRPVREAVYELNGRVEALALSQQGDLAAIADGSVSVWPRDRSPFQATWSEVAHAIAFRPGSRDLAVAIEGRLVLLTGASEEALTEGSFQALAFSTDGNLLVAAGQDGSLTVVNLTTRNVQSHECQCGASSLATIRGNLFRLQEEVKGPVYLFDGEAAQLTVVPASPGVSQ